MRRAIDTGSCTEYILRLIATRCKEPRNWTVFAEREKTGANAVLQAVYSVQLFEQEVRNGLIPASRRTTDKRDVHSGRWNDRSTLQEFVESRRFTFNEFIVSFEVAYRWKSKRTALGEKSDHHARNFVLFITFMICTRRKTHEECNLSVFIESRLYYWESSS